MVRLKVSSESADPSLSHGWSYFVENQAYTEHLAKYGVQVDTVHKFIPFSKIIELICDFEQRSTCVKHHAVKDANKSRSENLSVSGIGTIDCIRHNMKRPCAVGDLQKGEK
jgi:hypothetical protein